jgi:hypothetical protein
LVSGSLFLPHMVWLPSMMAASRWWLAPETLIPLMGRKAQLNKHGREDQLLQIRQGGQSRHTASGIGTT